MDSKQPTHVDLQDLGEDWQLEIKYTAVPRLDLGDGYAVQRKQPRRESPGQLILRKRRLERQASQSDSSCHNIPRLEPPKLRIPHPITLAIPLAHRVPFKHNVLVTNLQMKDAARDSTAFSAIVDFQIRGQLADELECLPKHDPDRFETLDELGNPACTNGQRVNLALRAIESFQGACRMDEDFEVATSDLICDLLHLVHSVDGSPKEVIESALFSFIAEAGRE